MLAPFLMTSLKYLASAHHERQNILLRTAPIIFHKKKILFVLNYCMALQQERTLASHVLTEAFP